MTLVADKFMEERNDKVCGIKKWYLLVKHWPLPLIKNFNHFINLLSPL